MTRLGLDTAPSLPDQLHPAVRAACTAAATALAGARSQAGRTALIEAVADGADGTPTSRLDQLVEDAIMEAVAPHRVNILSEECGFVDRGSAVTLAIDPVDGTGNAAAGLPLSAFTAAIAVDDALTEGFTYWFDTGRWWHARRDEPCSLTTTGRTELTGALVSMIRPKRDHRAFLEIAARADRTRVLGSSSLEAAWVAGGVLDAFVDAGSDTHRYVDLAAAVVLVEAAGGTVIDAAGRPLTFDPDITRRFSGIAASSRRLADEIASIIGAGAA
jgi:myo-inositol-1(or 4)-monophosphatase